MGSTCPMPNSAPRLAQRHKGCSETGQPCGKSPACGCTMEAVVERENEPIAHVLPLTSLL